MDKKQLIWFWGITTVALTLLFSTSLHSIIISFYFVTFLLPVAIGTSFFFNHYLVPNFLLSGRRSKFFLYFAYLLIVSIYLEMIVIIFSFVILADYQIENLGTIASDIYLMVIILYLVVFTNAFILALKNLRLKEERIASLEEVERKNQKAYLTLRVDRKNVQVSVDEITHIESLSDYTQVRTESATYITKEKISSIELLLPTFFIRIHRSFVVNRNYITSFTREFVEIGRIRLNIGRKYKSDVMDALRESDYSR